MRYEFIEQLKCHFYSYDGLHEMATTVLPHVTTNCRWRSSYGSGHHDGNTVALRRWSFVGREFPRGWTETVMAVDTYWDEGMDIYNKLKEDLENDRLPPPKDVRRKGHWSEEGGDEVDIDRLRRGLPFWRTTRRELREGPRTITILNNISTPCFWDSQAILWRGVASVCLTELLEAAGYRVELVACNFVDDAYESGGGYDEKQHRHCSSVRLKEPNEPLDVATLVNSVSGWCFRTLFFASLFQAQYRPTDWMGRPRLFKKGEFILPYITQDEKVLISQNLTCHEEAVEWVRGSLAELECHNDNKE